MKCPSCDKEFYSEPAISRYADLEICSECGEQEALDEFLNQY